MLMDFSSQVISISIIIIIGLFTFIFLIVMYWHVPKDLFYNKCYGQTTHKSHLGVEIVTCELLWIAAFWKLARKKVSKLFSEYEKKRAFTKQKLEKERMQRVICLMRCYEFCWHQHSKFRHLFLFICVTYAIAISIPFFFPSTFSTREMVFIICVVLLSV